MTSDNLLLLRPEHFTRSPWKNGQGSTDEIHKGRVASVQPVAGDDWDWRLSIAMIEKDAPFSQFDGIDRQLFLVSGNGMALHFEDESFELDAPLDGVEFSGEESVRAQLKEGATTDFNLMWRRDQAQILSVVLETVSQVELMEDEIMGVFAQEGSWRVNENTVGQGQVLLIHATAEQTIEISPETQGRALNFLIAPSIEPEDV